MTAAAAPDPGPLIVPPGWPGADADPRSCIWRARPPVCPSGCPWLA